MTDDSGGNDPGDTGSGDEDPGGNRWRRRLIVLLIVLVLVLAGGGIGTFVLDGGGGDGTPTAGTGATASPTPTTPTGEGNVSLTFLGERTFVSAGGVVPNESGESRRVVRNDGTVDGQLAVVSVNVSDSENGIVDPEAAVDDSPNEGELSQHLRVRLSVVYPGGDTVFVFGDGSDSGDGAFVPLSAVTATNETVGGGIGLGEEATLVFDWRISADADNEIQSDTAEFDIVFQLRQETESG